MSNNKPTCDLGTDGFTHTTTAAHRWCGSQVAVIRELFKNHLQYAKGSMWAYRHENEVHLSLDFAFSFDSAKSVNENVPIGMKDLCHAITFICCGTNTYEDEDSCRYTDLEVVDMAEAIHMAGIIIQSLQVPMTIGRLANEINTEVLATPLSGQETNGHLKLFL